MSRFTVNDTPSGSKTLVFAGPPEIRIHSAYDPVREAERAASAFNPGRATAILVCGLGLGYHVAALRSRLPNRAVIALEKDPEVVRLARASCPSNLEGAHIIGSPGDIPSLLESFDIDMFRGKAVYFHRPSYLLGKDFYDSMVADISRYFSSKLSDLLTRFEFEERWIANIFANLPRSFDAGRVADLFGKFSGFPGIIVSAGPSLRKNASMLGRLRGRALIVSVDTALKVLLRHGVEPHIVMTIDAQKHSIKHFLGERPGGTVLLADMVSYPRIADVYQGKIMFSTTAKYYNGPDGGVRREPTPAMDWVERHIEPPGDIQSGGSVATSAFDLLLNLGCSPIVLVGQDLAYTGREIHSTGTHHNGEWLTRTTRFLNLDGINQRVIRKRKIKYVEAYGGGGTVISDYVFDLYRSWFEDSALKVAVPVINAGGEGARIAGTVERPLESLLDEFPVRTPGPVEILRRSMAPGARSARALRTALEDALDATGAAASLAARPAGEFTDAERQLLLDTASRALPELFSPFLRRTNAYLARHAELSAERSAGILFADIAAAARKLQRHLASCRARIDDLP
ncbi:MAG TPA: 6-hydroxymethylpterin diphosphokinase MptE-like protein [Spirochaetota bacterium]|nr:6-hydroxymethylpterin diphosphokinase MptE-like protein [Spirochaetota bacterium]